MLRLIHWIADYLHPRGYRIDRPDGNDMYTLLLFKQPLDVWQEGGMVRAEENSCILFTKWAPQLYYSEEGDYRHDGVFFDGENPRRFLEKLEIPLNTVFTPPNPKALSSAIKEIGAEALLKETYTGEILNLQLQTLFYKLADTLKHGGSYTHSYFARFQQLRNEIFRRPELPWRAETLAGELHMSTSRFQHLYREFFSSTPARDVIQGRIEYAKYLLKSTDDAAVSIAASCGYNNGEHFMRQFKQWAGMTPGEYRRRYQ